MRNKEDRRLTKSKKARRAQYSKVDGRCFRLSDFGALWSFFILLQPKKPRLFDIRCRSPSCFVASGPALFGVSMKASSNMLGIIMIFAVAYRPLPHLLPVSLRA